MCREVKQIIFLDGEHKKLQKLALPDEQSMVSVRKSHNLEMLIMNPTDSSVSDVAERTSPTF